MPKVRVSLLRRCYWRSFFITVILVAVKRYSVVLNCFFLLAKGVDCRYMYLLAVCVSSLENCLFILPFLSFFLPLASFALQYAFTFPSCLPLAWQLVSFNCWIISSCKVYQFVHPSPTEWHPGHFQFWTMMTRTANTLLKTFCVYVHGKRYTTVSLLVMSASGLGPGVLLTSKH